MTRNSLKALALFALLTTADASAKPIPTKPAHPVTQREAALPFLLDITPHFEGGEKALQLRAEGDLDGAIAALKAAGNAASRRSPKHGSRPPVPSARDRELDAQRKALLADLLVEQKQFEEAAGLLDGLDKLLPSIADHVLLMRGKALTLAGKPDAALDTLRQIPNTSPLFERATQLCVRGELERRQPQAAIALLDGLVAQRPLPELSPETLLLLGDTLAALQNRNEEALAAYRALKLTHPLSGQAKKADSGLKLLTTRGVKNPDWSLRERLTMASSLFSANLNEAATQKLGPLLEELNQSNASAEERCQASFMLGVAQQNQRKYTDSVEPLTLASSLCTPDVQAKAVFRLVRADLNRKQPDVALNRATTFAQQHPEQSIADDALFAVAASLQDDGKLEDAARLFQAQIDQFPSGDMRAEAAWRLAWIDFRNGQLENAIRRVEGTLQSSRFLNDDLPVASSVPITTSRSSVESAASADSGSSLEVPAPAPTPILIAGGGLSDNPRLTREAYWRARWFEQLGRRAEAVEAYVRLATRAPTDFYGALAVERLRTAAPEKVSRLEQAPADLLAPSGKYPTALAMSAQPVPVQRTVPLLQAGLQRQAVDELMPLFQQVDFPDPLLLSYLFEGAGRFDLSHRVAKRVLDFNATLQPTRENRTWFLYTFPMAYPGYMQKACSAQNIDPLLLTALSREESAFDPDIRSWAGALGLTQLMEPTAARMAKDLNLPPPSAEDLTHPDLNLTLGARYLRKLLDMFNNHPGLAVPSYNAGEGAVSKWLKLRGDQPFDAFVEEIPYKQTRDYVKRVISTYQTYHYLYHTQQRFVSLPINLPGSLPSGTPSGPASSSGQ